MLPLDDTAACASEGSVDCAIHAKGKTALDVATEIARAVSSALPEHIDELTAMLREALHERHRKRFNVIIDALDEATTPTEARAIVTEIVLPLVEDFASLGVQVVIGTRRDDADGNLLAEFGAAQLTVDLDHPDYFAKDDLAEYTLAALQLGDDERESNPYKGSSGGGAPGAPRVAHRIAELADRNFLVAGLVARTHALHDDKSADPATLSFTPTVDVVLRDYVERLDPVDGIPAETLLGALAFAEAPGISIELWRAAVDAIAGRAPTTEGLSWFAESAAAKYLIDWTGPETARVCRLFHQALNDALLAARAEMVPRGTDEEAITRAFLELGRRHGWGSAPQYLLRSLPGHAARGGMIDALLADDEYLLHADLLRLMPFTEQARSAAGRDRARLLQLTPRAISASAMMRIALFSVTEALEKFGRAYAKTDQPVPYRAAWASAAPHAERAILEGHTRAVHDVCAFTLDRRALLASVGEDAVRIWDPVTGQQQRALEGEQDGGTGLCAFTLGEKALLAVHREEMIRILDPATGQVIRTLEGHTRPDHIGESHGVRAFRLDSRTLLAAVDPGGIEIWDPATGQQIHEIQDYYYYAKTLLPFSLNGRVLLASYNWSDIKIWNPATGLLHQTLQASNGRVIAACLLAANGQTLLASISDEGMVHIWDLATGQQARTLDTHTNWGDAFCALPSADGRARLAIADSAGALRICDPATGQQERILQGHTRPVNAICSFTLNEHSLIASVSNDRTVRIWDPAAELREPLPEDHGGPVNAVCGFTLDGHPLIASASSDRTVRIWDPATGQPERMLQGHTGPVNGVCAFTLDRHTLLASASSDRTVRIWDAVTGQHQRTSDSHSGWDSVRAICAITARGQVLLASASDHSVRIWDPTTGQRHRTLVGHTTWVRALCPFTLDGHGLLATAGDDRTIRIWDPATGEQHRTLQGHAGPVNGVCAFTFDGHTLLATVSDDHTVRIWDPHAHGQPPRTLHGHTQWDLVRAVCTVTLDGHDLLATAGSDHTVRIWDPQDGSCLLAIPVHHSVYSLTWVANALIVGGAGGLLALDLKTPPQARTD